MSVRSQLTVLSVPASYDVGSEASHLAVVSVSISYGFLKLFSCACTVDFSLHIL